VLALEPVAPGEQLALRFGEAGEVPSGDGALGPGAGPPGPAGARTGPGVASATALDEPAPAPRPPAPATLSYTALARYTACPYRFHLERGLGLPEQEPPPHLRDAEVPGAEGAALDPLMRGTLVHELLERRDPSAPAPGEAEVRALAEAHEVELGDADVADLLGMVAAFAASPVAARLAAAAELRREHAFAFPLGAGAPLITGVVDVLARERDGAQLVVDYKSDHVEGADLEALVEASYGAQRRIYALACLRAGAPAVEVVHVFLERAAEPVSRRYEAGEIPVLERDLRDRAAGLLAGEFPVAAVPHRALCATCPGRAGLCTHPPERTDRTVEEALGRQ
jgi:ATP-dependent helicase/nuclease subunit A